MKKILSFLMAIVLVISLGGCTSASTDASGVKIVADDGISARVENSVLYVSCPDNMQIDDITVDGRRVWLSDGKYAIPNENQPEKIVIEADDIEISKGETKISSVLLSLYDSGTNSYSVTWHTGEKNNSDVLLECLNDSEKREITPYCDEGNDDYVNRAVFYELKYGCEYKYTILNSDGSENYSATFSTKEENPNEITFMHISDTQDEEYNGEVWKQLMDYMYSSGDSPDFILHTGDMVQYGGDEKLWQQMLGNVENYVSSVPTILTSGNHSYWSDYTNGASSIEYNHTTVNLPEQDTENGIYYSFDYGDVHFTVLSSGDSSRTGVGSKQRKWLENDLASTDKKWKIVAIHNPLYSPGKYGSSSDRNQVALSLQKKLGSIFNEYNVDLVLEGHDHAFALTKPIDENSYPLAFETDTREYNSATAEYFIAPDAPIYLMSAAGGSQNREVVDTYDPSLYVTAQPIEDYNAGYSVITVTENTLTSTFYKYNYKSGTLTAQYSWGIEK